MTALIIPNAWQVRLTWALDNTPWAQNVLHYRPSDAGLAVTQSVVDFMEDEITAAYTASGMKAQQADNWELLTVGVRDIRTANNPELLASSGVNGTGTAHVLPLQNAAVVTLRTALAGPSYRGRIYYGGWTEAGSSALGSIEDPVAITAVAFTQAIQILSLPGPADSVTLGVGSRVQNEINDVTGVVMRDRVWDTQRRRRDGLPGG